MKPCRHCKSPARGNPCWYAINYPNYAGDPPCIDDDYSDEWAERTRRNGIRARVIVTVIGLIVATMLSVHFYFR